MNQLSIASFKSKYSQGFYSTFAIDGAPLEVWLPTRDPAAQLHLVAAHAGLYGEDDNELVWDRSYSTAPGWTTLVPLLVCSDDLDLSCTVIVVEQHAHEDHIHWRRFGLLHEVITLEQPRVSWFEAACTATFERAEFHHTLDEFRRLEGVVMAWD
ncbi:hypothetical protein NP552_25200 [Pseudomonas sp. 8209]|uniref:hypothetical protein n=1 Tax=Pseudomonas sp. 8209 TaxID=2967214 RepID=UPI0023647AEE|nr:hypothetical protein [Pseudomonas sp. 8209]MDD1958335.1 hypothetical protein [Pseudomonas sp. 8209]